MCMNLNLVKWMDPLENWMRCICNNAQEFVSNMHMKFHAMGVDVDVYHV